ncbi:ATP-binding protein [Pseudonocardia sp. DR1-2]|uniref:AAA family ATPase n=1 Tax=Pseudonocardia sp. DR1-2 TaxID=2951168 RepID=UPI002043B154|nr:ATP-binding protein [Pseudonocardia sp. DR1-2]MCM3846316.1 ATP-binding protein [Pseudonocardia sp. DR1-2]
MKANPNATKKGWQDTSDGWLPHVRVRLEDDITAVVGANESGKSHLLDAINIALTGKEHSQRDFCRYSNLFSVETGQRLYPEIGARLEIAEADAAAIANLDIPLLSNNELLMIRPEPGTIQVLNSTEERVRLTEFQRVGLEALLPYAYHLKTQVDLPDSVSIAALAGTEALFTNRRQRINILRLLSDVVDSDGIGAKAPELLKAISGSANFEEEQQALGRLLLTKVARIDSSAFIDLQDAISNEREGLVNALIQEMNDSIARHLNISKWWSQDEDFQLRVSPREHELVFTIRDRTGTDYSFSERSRGLTFFLSYYVQLRSHDRPQNRPEVLLMDEPDAYLSALGQQDLLRVLENHANPEDSERTDQIVYVTHSPFLINRNAGYRVRVVDKGARDEGTRLVKDATQNHYEPLRTSLGAFVAETAFIGGDNLFIEGIADQVLISGMNSRLRRQGKPPSECLDLNQVTLVAGGANIPYMLHLARGRDQYKPACAVLLDGDSAGKSARRAILKGGDRGRPTVPEDLIIMVSDWAHKVDAQGADGVTIEEPEDLVPIDLAGAAARRYAVKLLGATSDETAALTNELIQSSITPDNPSLWDAVAKCFLDAFETEIGKVGFAKELVSLLNEYDSEPEARTSVGVLDANFAALIRHLAEKLRLARDREYDSRREHRVNRIIEEFADDYPTGCIRDRASVMLSRIDAATDNSTAGDTIRAGTTALRRDYRLSSEPLERVPDYPLFLERLRHIPVLVRLEDQGVLDKEALTADTSKPRGRAAGRPTTSKSQRNS